MFEVLRFVPKQLASELAEKADIVKIIEYYQPVLKAGKNFKTLCLFHQDHDPSLTIYPSTHSFYCFVCKTSGNVFDFVMKAENLSYPAAVSKVAQISGFDPDRWKALVGQQGPVKPLTDQELKQERLKKIVSQSVAYFHYLLLNQEESFVQDFLIKRGLSLEIIKEFSIGYDDGNYSLLRFLISKGFKLEDIQEVGLIQEGKNGPYDPFQGRLMFPIADRKGQPLAFTARLMKNNGYKGKYINSTNNPLYNKSEIIYNLDRVISYHHDQAPILCEGVMDVLAFYRAGYPRAMALLGTSLTEGHRQLLAPFKKHLILAFDGDKAGRTATYHNGQALVKDGFILSIMDFDDKSDPDDLLQNQGPQALLNKIDSCMSWLDFVFDYGRKTNDLDHLEGKKAFVQMMTEHLSQADALSQDHFVQKISLITGFSQEAILALCKPQKKNIGSTKRPFKRTKVVSSPYLLAEKLFLSYMLLGKDQAEQAMLARSHLISSEAVDLAVAIDASYHNDNLDFNEVKSLLKSEKTMVLWKQVYDLGKQDQLLTTDFNDVLDQLRRIKVSQNSQLLQKKLRECTDPKQQKQVLQLIINNTIHAQKKGGSNHE